MKNPISQAFLDRLIDYAGLFPPACLSLNQAIKEYEKYINSDDYWMLGPFIIPVTKLAELQAYQNLFFNRKPLSLSVVGRKSESIHNCLLQLKEDLEQIRSYVRESHHWYRIEAFEIPLPPVVPTQGLLEDISMGASTLGMKVFCEVSLQKDENWQKKLSHSLDSIAAFNSLHKGKIGVKLRTGGIRAEMFPSPYEVAFVLASCRDRKLPLKFTAGLHHPIRMYREEVKTKMHGFLNIFLAGMLAYQFNLEETRIDEVLSDENADHFKIFADGLAWKNLRITTQEIEALRRQFLCSFGSCSFVEPRDEFFELSIQREGIK